MHSGTHTQKERDRERGGERRNCVIGDMIDAAILITRIVKIRNLMTLFACLSNAVRTKRPWCVYSCLLKNYETDKVEIKCTLYKMMHCFKVLFTVDLIIILVRNFLKLKQEWLIEVTHHACMYIHINIHLLADLDTCMSSMLSTQRDRQGKYLAL